MSHFQQILRDTQRKRQVAESPLRGPRYWTCRTTALHHVTIKTLKEQNPITSFSSVRLLLSLLCPGLLWTASYQLPAHRFSHGGSSEHTRQGWFAVCAWWKPSLLITAPHVPSCVSVLARVTLLLPSCFLGTSCSSWPQTAAAPGPCARLC